MRILISNDDGYQAPGVRALFKAMGERFNATMVAPDRNRSAASNSLTLSHPVLVRSHGENVFSVEGTPTDCVSVAIGGGLLADEPDMVVSGVNDGPNMGDDVLYSGTVAAAIEGRSLGHPAIAVSMASGEPAHFDTAARVAVALVEHLVTMPLPGDTILNVNVPDVPHEQLRGYSATRLGSRHRGSSAVEQRSPRGERVFWIGAAGAVDDRGPDTDFRAIEEGRVSVTPLQIDLTRRQALPPLGQWLERMP